MIDPKDHDPPQTKKTNTLDLHRESLRSLGSGQLRAVVGGHKAEEPCTSSLYETPDEK
jgi:hypothetical protein